MKHFIASLLLVVCGAVVAQTTTSAPGYTITGQTATESFTVVVPPAAATVTYTPISSAPPPPAAPIVSLTAVPASTTAGAASQLAWTGLNATSCSGVGTGTSGTASVTPAVTTAYTETCTGAGGSASASATVTVTQPVTPPTSGVYPPAGMPVSGPGVIFAQGNYFWKSDWDGSNVTSNYKATLNGIPVISFATNGAWPQWIPYPPLGANGAPNPIINTNGWSNLVFYIKPANVGDQINVQGVIYKPGTTITTDVVAGSVSGVSAYASPADSNGFMEVKIPLSVLGLANTTYEYKITIQENGARAGQTWYLAYVAEF